MTVTIASIREVLIGVTESNLPDATIARWINVATTIAEGNIGENVTTANKEEMIEILASYYSLVSYATYIHTSGGRIPNAIIAQMTELSKVASVLMSIHSRADGAMAPDWLLVVPTESLLDDGR